MIRQATPQDYARVEEIYVSARAFMKTRGNPWQWGDNFPPAENLHRALAQDELYVLVDEGDRPYGAFVFWTDRPEPRYATIYEGAWHFDEPYFVIQHLASDGSHTGVFNEVFNFAFQYGSYSRIDTHADNHPLQRVATAYGFRYCGRVRKTDGTWRLAYDLKR